MSEEFRMVTVVAVALVLLALIASATCRSCNSSRVEACKAIQEHGSPESKALAMAYGGVCDAIQVVKPDYAAIEAELLEAAKQVGVA